jgi:hypothetical protein
MTMPLPSSDRLTVESMRRALTAQPLQPPEKTVFVVPPVLADLAREHFGSAAEVIVQARIPMATDYDDYLLRRKKPQPNPKPRAG